MFIRCLPSKEFKRKIPEISNSIMSLYGDDIDPMIISNRFVTSSLVQKYIHFKSDNIHNKIIKPIILDAAIRSEKIGPGGGDICLKIISSLLKDDKDINFIDKEKDIRGASKNPNRDDIIRLIKLNTVSDIQFKTISSIIDRMTSNTPIFLEKINSVDSQIRCMSGYTFNIGARQEYISNRRWSFEDVRCFVIDGFIESVSEIHHLLESAAKNNLPHVIFARHFAEDVDSTLLHNFKRGTINIIPINVGFDENTLNILNDISICTKSDIVSPLKGDLISKAVQNDPAIVKKITISKNSVSIVENDSSMIKSHLKYLNDKRIKSADHPELVEIFDKRIKSLSSGRIEIKIGTEMLSEDPQIIERFDEIFRKIGSIIQTGVVYKDDLLKVSDTLYSAIEENHPYSTLSVISALRNSYSACNSIKSIDHVVYAE